MKMNASRQTGFTLVEIMIVVAIIGLLAAMAIPNFQRAHETTQLRCIVSNLLLIENAKNLWATENKKSPGDTATSADLAIYMSNSAWVKPQATETYNINAVGTLASASGFKLIGKTSATADGATQ
jgi:prepilin-type N-terminal cleavage/methylation domain-containing protein